MSWMKGEEPKSHAFRDRWITLIRIQGGHERWYIFKKLPFSTLGLTLSVLKGKGIMYMHVMRP